MMLVETLLNPDWPGWLIHIHPGLLLIAGSLLVPLTRGWSRSAWLLLLSFAALYLAWNLPTERQLEWSFLDYTLTLMAVDYLSRLFAVAFTLMTFAGVLFCCRQAAMLEIMAALVYAGSALGAVLAGDLITLFVFWELMAVASTLVIWSRRTASAWRASLRYLQIHLFGGVLLMAGIVGHVIATGSSNFVVFSLDTTASWLILAGFLVNAAAWPLSAWVPDAYPESSFSGMVFLSAFTTKTAVYVLLRAFPGADILIVLGLVMVIYGIVYALLENDIRRILAYSIVNQVGFMLVGIGIGTELSLNGAASQAFVHILYKGLLLMTAGAVMYQTGRQKCTELGGLFQSMPLTTACAVIGALTVMAFPLTSGFVTKSMINSAAAEEHLIWVWLLLQAGSAGAVLHAGLKYPWFVFFQPDQSGRGKPEPADPPLNMRLAMILLAFFCILIGMAPCQLYRLLPYAVNYEPYTAGHILGQLQLLLFAALAFFVLLKWLQPRTGVTLDVDWLYRRGIPRLLPALFWLLDKLAAQIGYLAAGLLSRLQRMIIQIGRQEGRLANDVAIGESVFMVVLLLSVCLLLYLA